MKKLFLFVTAASMMCSIGISAEAQNAAQPNIVLILVDDLGYGDIGPFGSTKNRTPALDRMSREGTKFTSFYAAPVCSPARAQVLTGSYAQRVSIPRPIMPDDKHGLNPTEQTVAERLKTVGYQTMCLGKWHLGYEPEFLPTHHGFDHYFGLPYDRRIKLPLMRDDQVIEVLEGNARDTSTERYTEEAVRFIGENRARPFLLYFAHTAVHVPMHPGKNFRGRSANGIFGDWVEEVDWSVGRVLDTLRELNLDENTLVIFTSDNGPWLRYGAEAGTAGPLRGGKGSTWEGGVRVPTIAWWPNRVPANRESDVVAGVIDFLPTFVTLAGGTVGAEPRIDGKDISSLLFGTTTQSPHEAFYYYRDYQLEAVRAGPWKLALHPQIEALGEKNFPPDATTNPRLYNLDTDIGERTNLAATHPGIVTRLQSFAKRMAADLGDGQPGPGVRPPGYASQPP